MTGALARMGWRLERVDDAGLAIRLGLIGAALAVAVALCSLLFLMAGASPGQAFFALAKGAFGTRRAMAETLVNATPLIFTGLATAVAFRARIWNIGAEGQVFAGAIGAYGVQHYLPGWPAPVQIGAAMLGAMAGGALYAALAGVLKTRFRVDEVISTVMLNYIIAYVLSMLLLKGPWSEAGGFFEQTAKVDPGSVLPVILPGTSLHVGVVFALVATALLAVVIQRTPFGYDIRALGANGRALEVQGGSIARTTILVMALSGALAGMAALTEVYGVHERLKPGAIIGIGYAGIIVAILGQLNPWFVALAGLFFGALVNGATYMQIKTGVPSALIYAIEAILLLCYLAGRALSSFRLRKAARHD